jgi:nondiscriminating aspartyl-tRNA synthetase
MADAYGVGLDEAGEADGERKEGATSLAVFPAGKVRRTAVRRSRRPRSRAVRLYRAQMRPSHTQSLPPIDARQLRDEHPVNGGGCTSLRGKHRQKSGKCKSLATPTRHRPGGLCRVPSMERTRIAELGGKVGEQVTIRGWVHVVRDQKRMQFVVVRDESGLAQVVLGKEDPPSELNELLSRLTAESAVTVSGEVVADERVKLGGLELQLEGLEVDSPAEPELPIAPDSALDKRIDWRYLDLRRPDRKLIFEVQSTVEHAMREYWREDGFIEIHTPKLMGSASESGAELFKVEYFERTAYLAQSPQFYKQMAMAAGFGKVFEIGPVFRANPSFTSRHDTEFTSVDVELSWIDSHEDVMAFEESWLAYVLGAVKDAHGSEIEETFDVELTVPDVPFPRVTLEQAKELLRDAGLQALGVEHDLDPPSERALSALIKEKEGHEFVFVMDYPTSVRPFYHMRHSDDPTLTKSFDLLWRGIELTTGAQREHRYEQLLRQASEKRVETGPIQYYLDFFRCGAPPHGGFGFGLTRLLMQLLGQENVREVTFLYRGPNRLTP